MKLLLLYLVCFFTLTACSEEQAQSTESSSVTISDSTQFSSKDSLPENTHNTTSITQIQEDKTVLPTLPKRSVLDYFMRLPENDYFQCDCEDEIVIRERKSFIKKVNLSDGYILARDGCGELDLAIVLFRDKIKNRDIIAVGNIWVPGDYFCMVDGDMGLFYLNDREIWENVTTQLIDEKEIRSKVKTSRYVFLYPEKGTTIKILSADDTNIILGYLKWKNGRFKLKAI